MFGRKKGSRNKKPMLQRFEEKYTPCPNTGCWLWIGSFVAGGYGYMWFNGDHNRAHRVSYFWKTGEWPEVVRHKCHNPACVNPDHLEGGSHQDNANDRVDRGTCPSGEDHWNYKHGKYSNARSGH